MNSLSNHLKQKPKLSFKTPVKFQYQILVLSVGMPEKETQFFASFL